MFSSSSEYVFSTSIHQYLQVCYKTKVEKSSVTTGKDVTHEDLYISIRTIDTKNKSTAPLKKPQTPTKQNSSQSQWSDGTTLIVKGKCVRSMVPQ